jgi:hypothetical protein
MDPTTGMMEPKCSLLDSFSDTVPVKLNVVTHSPFFPKDARLATSHTLEHFGDMLPTLCRESIGDKVAQPLGFTRLRHLACPSRRLAPWL